MANAHPGTQAQAAPLARGGRLWSFLVEPKWLGWHALMVITFWGMLWLGDWQLHRALTGNGLSWAYTFEWPLFAGFSVVFWAKTIKDEIGIRRGGIARPSSAAVGLPEGFRVAQVSAAVQASDADDDDPELSAYNRYLAQLNAEAEDRGR